jgi:hypothetical protein
VRHIGTALCKTVVGVHFLKFNDCEELRLTTNTRQAYAYCSVLKMRLTYKARVQAVKYSRLQSGEGHIDPVKHTGLCPCVTLFPLVAVSEGFVYNSRVSNVCTYLTRYNTTENKCITSHAQNTTAFQLNVSFTGIRRLVIRNKRRSAFPSANNGKVNCKLLSQYQYCYRSNSCGNAITVASYVCNSEPTLHIF